MPAPATTAHRPRHPAAPAAALAAGQGVGSHGSVFSREGVGGLPVLRLPLANGLLVEIQDAATVAATVVRLLEHEQAARLAAEAEQTALATVYRLGGEPDEARPYGGLLTRRLDISERTAGELIRTGKLRYTCTGKKCYRVSELAVREFLGDCPGPPG